jgi:hypothetical protein
VDTKVLPLNLLIPELPTPFGKQRAQDLGVILPEKGDIVLCKDLEEVIES